MMRFLLTLALFIFSFSIFAQATNQNNVKAGAIDTHMHFMPSRSRQPRQQSRELNFYPSAEELIKKMDQMGVEKAIIMPPPQGYQQRGSYSGADLKAAIDKYPTRFILGAGGGELSPLIFAVDAGSVTQKHKNQFVDTAMKLVASGAKVFAEMTALHFALGPNHPFKQTPADHPLFLLLADISAKTQIPIDLHIEAVEKNRNLPPALKMRSEENPSTIQATIPALKNLLAHNRKAIIVWQHVAWDNTGEMTFSLLRHLIKENPNLYMGLKFVQKKYEPFQQGQALADTNLKIDKNWVSFIQEFPDRFVVGADEFPAPSGGTSQRQGPPPSFIDTWSVIKQLPPALYQQVAIDNAKAIYHF